ncbi:MAG: OmpA family protein [Pseudomonadota bacterium]
MPAMHRAIRAAGLFAVVLSALVSPAVAKQPVLNAEAERMLVDAARYESMRELRVARTLWRSVIDRFPGSVAAERAASKLAKAAPRSSFGQPSRLGGPDTRALKDGAGWARRGAQKPSLPTWRSAETWTTLIRPAQTLQDHFRSEIGDRVFFAAYSSDLGQKGKAVLEAQIAWLKQRPDVIVTIEAHADEPGARADNQKMAEDRGHAIRSYLEARGVEKHRVRVVALGKTKPIALCETPACRAQNRRVVMKVADAAQSPAR